MSLGGFGDKLFEVSTEKLYGFYDESYDIGLDTEDQEVDGEKPSVYVKNESLINPSINIDLRQSSTIDVDSEFTSWKEILKSREKHMLFLGNEPISDNKYLLVKITPSNVEYSPQGKRVRMTLGLTFKEYPRDGVKKESTSS